jgi:nitronate monooxygenase
MTEIRQRVGDFCERFGLRLPILQAPMASASPPELAIAVAEAGGMGAGGMVRDDAGRIAAWAERFRSGSSGAFQLNVWVPGPPGEHPDRIEAAREFLQGFGPPGDPAGGSPPEFRSQCEAMLAARPTAISSIMGLFEPDYVRRLHSLGIAWFACATTLDEALAAQDAGADAIVAQGMEAGGHRGGFDQDAAERVQVGLVALLPRFADRLNVPVIAAGGIADGRGVAAALALGAAAVQVGTALLRCPETGISEQWAAALDGLAPESTVTTRAYTGRTARAAPTAYLRAWTEPGAPRPAPYPEQRRLVNQWRRGEANGVDKTDHWAGQSAALATDEPAGVVVGRMWRDASALLV